MSSAYDVGLTAHACRRRALPRGSVRLRGRAPDADGNGAFDQRQNDVFGAVLDSILLHLPRSRPAAASAMADRPVAGPVRYGVWREPFDDRLRCFLARTTYQVSSVSGRRSVLLAVSASDNLPMMLGSGW